MDYKKQFKSRKLFYYWKLIGIATDLDNQKFMLRETFDFEKDDSILRELETMARRLTRLAIYLKKHKFEDLKLWVRKPCDNVQGCRVLNEAPDLTYDEWVDTYCGACPDCVFELEPKE